MGDFRSCVLYGGFTCWDEMMGTAGGVAAVLSPVNCSIERRMM